MGNYSDLHINFQKNQQYFKESAESSGQKLKIKLMNTEIQQ